MTVAPYAACRNFIRETTIAPYDRTTKSWGKRGKKTAVGDEGSRAGGGQQCLVVKRHRKKKKRHRLEVKRRKKKGKCAG
eukprot:918358-Rhodomonas_salina.2